MSKLRTLTLVIALTLAVAACGDDDGTDSSQAGTTATTAAPTASSAPGSTTEPATTAAPGTTAAPATTTAPATTADPAESLPPEPVTFTAGDGLSLEGMVYPAGPNWVILGHMLPADMTSWMPFAEMAQDAGFSALVFNNRGYGDSDPGDPAVMDIGSDGVGAVAFARERGAGQIVFAGASMNGATALFLAAEDQLAGIVGVSASREWDNTPGLSRADEITEPSLFFGAGDDGAAVAEAEEFAEALLGVAITVDTGGHGTDMLDANPELYGDLLEFLGTAFG